MTSSAATAARKQQPTHPTARAHPATRGARRGGASHRVGGRGTDVVADAATGATASESSLIRSVTPIEPGSEATARLTSTCGPGGAGRVHGVRAGRRLREVGAGQGVASLEHAHRLTELLDRARGGDVVATADPVLHEIGSPDTEEDQEDQARRRLHVTTVGARRRRAPDPHRCVAQVTGVTTVPGASSRPCRPPRGDPASRSQRLAGEVLGRQGEGQVVAPGPGDVQVVRAQPLATEAQLAHHGQAGGVLGPDVDLDAVQPERAERVVARQGQRGRDDHLPGDRPAHPVADVARPERPEHDRARPTAARRTGPRPRRRTAAPGPRAASRSYCSDELLEGAARARRGRARWRPTPRATRRWPDAPTGRPARRRRSAAAAAPRRRSACAR